MPAVLMPMEEFAMKKLDGTLVNVLLVTREQTAKLVTKKRRVITLCSIDSNIS